MQKEKENKKGKYGNTKSTKGKYSNARKMRKKRFKMWSHFNTDCRPIVQVPQVLGFVSQLTEDVMRAKYACVHHSHS